MSEPLHPEAGQSPLRSPQDEERAYHALCAYTLELGDAAFIHQHVVDAYTAQNADERTQPIAVTFSLVGLYLLVERGWTGRQVQRAHMRLATRKHSWPPFSFPLERGSMTVIDVLRSPEGPERNAAIHAWARAVWAAFADNRSAVEELLRRHGVA